MKNNERGFCIFYDWLESLEYMPREITGEIVFALRDYYVEGVDPVERFSGVERAVVKMMLAQIKRAELKSREKRGHSIETETETETETEKTKETKTKKERVFSHRSAQIEGEWEGEKIYKIPTEAEVRAYKEREQLDFTDSDEFYAYNRERNWEIDGEPIRDWRGAMKRWNRKKRAFAAKETRRGEEPGDKEKNNSCCSSRFSGFPSSHVNFDVEYAFNKALERSYGTAEWNSG